MPGRTDNEIKNYWNTNLGKKAQDRKTPVSLPRKKENRPPLTAVSGSQMKKMSTEVVRTKAVRCSKVIINPQLAPLKAEPINSKSNDVTGPSEGVLAGSTTNVDGSSSFAGDEDIALDFMDVGEFCLSELLKCDFSDLFGLGCCNERIDDVPPLCDQNVSFSDELLQNWAAGDGVQPNVDRNLDSLSPLIDYGEIS